MSAVVVAVANLKGGVGKSTTAVMLAEALAYRYAQRVLVIDLDPQASSSAMLLSPEGVSAADTKGGASPDSSSRSSTVGRSDPR